MAERRIRISITDQRLDLLEGDRVLAAYRVSTAARGAGEQRDSEQTPRGRHAIDQKIGDGCEIGSVFEARRATGEICTPERFAAEPARDWILTRILWLTGLEPGHNRDENVDTKQRFIYIHGTPDTANIGRSRSHGCIRMTNEDVLALFDQVEPGTVVDIEE